MSPVTAALGIAKKPVRPLLSVREAAELISVSPKAVVRLINDDLLRAIDVNAGRKNRRILRIAPEEITRFLGVNSTHKPDNNQTA
jgi:excisionase family DNA binding protein